MQLLCEAKDQLASSKKQIAALKKELEKAHKLKDHAEKLRAEAEKARDKAEHHGYDIGVVETEDTLQAQVIAVCRTYYAQTWEEALNQARVKASSVLRRPESIYFPPAIRTSDLPSTQGELASTVADMFKEAQPQDPFPPNQHEQAKEPEVSKETSPDKAAGVPQDGVASQDFQQALASTTMPAEGASKDKEETIPTEADKPTNKTSKLQIKLKQ